MKRLTATIISILLLFSITVSANIIYMPNVPTEVTTSEFWSNKIQNSDRLLLTPSQISKINSDTLSKPQTNMNDLRNINSTFDCVKLVDELKNFKIEQELYIGEQVVDPTYYQNVRENISNPNAQTVQNIQYGFCVRSTNLKIYPFDKIISDDKSDLEYDEFQNSRLSACEPLVIFTNTRDNKWLYVYNSNCSGWALAEDIAICNTKEEWLSYIDTNNFLVVTGNKILLEENLFSPNLSALMLDMGTILPLASNDEIDRIFGTLSPGGNLDSRTPYGNYIVIIPTRDENGKCIFSKAMIPVNRDVNIGYLSFTQKNILNQLFKCQGDRYGWGGMLNAHDCSEYLCVVYKCFGLSLPRNTSWQTQMPVRIISLQGYSDLQKQKIISTLPAGTLLEYPGHIMAFLGEYNDDLYVINSLGSVSADDKQAFSRVRSVVVNNLDVRRSNQIKWLTELNYAIEFTQPFFDDISDVPQKDDILSLAYLGIIYGKSENKFCPNDILTVNEFSVLLSRAFKLDYSDAQYLATCNGTVNGSEQVTTTIVNQVITMILDTYKLPSEGLLMEGDNKGVTRATFSPLLLRLTQVEK